MAAKVTEQYQAITCYAPDLGKSSTLHRTSMAIQWSTLWWRNVLFAKRQPLVIIGRVAMCLFLAGSMLTVYWHKLGWHRHNPLHPFPDQEEIQNTTGAMFLLMMEIMLANSLCNFLVFQVERECFLREYSSKMYSLTPYYLTTCILEFPLLLLTPLLMELILFWGC